MTDVVTLMRRALAGSALALCAAGCVQWLPEGPSPGRAVSASRGRPVRVTLTDGRRVELRRASVVRDSIVGDPVAQPVGGRWAAALADVTLVEIAHPDYARTRSGVLVGLVAGAALLLYFLSQAFAAT